MKKKISIVLIMILLISFIFILEVHAEEIDVNYWTPDRADSNTKLESVAEKMLGVFQVIGTIASIVVLIFIGMKYMLSSIEEKAKMKGVMGYYITGCVLVFSITNILGLTYDMVDDFQHSYSEIYYDNECYAATCTTTGKAKRKCIGEGGLCNCTDEKPHVIEVSIPINGNAHSWEEDSVIKVATCTTQGTKGTKCGLCHIIKDIQDYGPLGHDFSVPSNVVYQHKTCSHGTTYYYKCGRTGCDQRSTTGPYYDDGIRNYEFSGHCKQRDTNRRRCSRCVLHKLRLV